MILSDGSFNHIHPGITDRVVDETVRQAQREVNRAFNSTLSALHDPSQPRTPSDLLSLFRLPRGRALEITRSAEVFERTLQALHRQVFHGDMYNSSHTGRQVFHGDMYNISHTGRHVFHGDMYNISHTGRLHWQVLVDVCGVYTYSPKRTLLQKLDNLRHKSRHSAI